MQGAWRLVGPARAEGYAEAVRFGQGEVHHIDLDLAPGNGGPWNPRPFHVIMPGQWAGNKQREARTPSLPKHTRGERSSLTEHPATVTVK